jgi:hypothetical protein
METLPREMIREIAGQVDYFTMDQWKATSREMADMLEPFHGLQSLVKSIDGGKGSKEYSTMSLRYYYGNLFFLASAPLDIIERYYGLFLSKRKPPPLFNKAGVCVNRNLDIYTQWEAVASNAHIRTFQDFYALFVKRDMFGHLNDIEATDVAVALISADRDIHFMLDMKQHPDYCNTAVNLQFKANEPTGWMFPSCLDRPDWEDVIMNDSIGLFCRISQGTVGTMPLDERLRLFTDYLLHNSEPSACRFRHAQQWYQLMITYILPNDKDGKRADYLLPRGIVGGNVFTYALLFLINERLGLVNQQPVLRIGDFLLDTCSMDGGTNCAFLLWFRDQCPSFPHFQLSAIALKNEGLNSNEHHNACYYLSLLDDMNLLDMDGPKCLRKGLREFVAAHRAKKQKMIQH